MFYSCCSLQCRRQLAFTLVLHYYALWLARKSRTTFSANQKSPKPMVSHAHTFSRPSHTFPAPACNFFEFWLVHWLAFLDSDWLRLFCWFWIYVTHLKTALYHLQCFLLTLGENKFWCKVVQFHWRWNHFPWQIKRASRTKQNGTE